MDNVEDGNQRGADNRGDYDSMVVRKLRATPYKLGFLDAYKLHMQQFTPTPQEYNAKILWGGEIPYLCKLNKNLKP